MQTATNISYIISYTVEFDVTKSILYLIIEKRNLTKLTSED